MSKWTKVPPDEPGWFWVKSKLFSKTHPIEVRIVEINQLGYGRSKRVEYWDAKKSDWVLSDSYIQLWQKVDNQPIDFEDMENDK